MFSYGTHQANHTSYEGNESCIIRIIRDCLLEVYGWNAEQGISPMLKSRILLFQAFSYRQVELRSHSWGVMEDFVKIISRRSTNNNLRQRQWHHEAAYEMIATKLCFVRTIGANDFFEKDHVGMLESLQELDLAKCCNGESVFLLFCVNALKGDNFVRSFVSSHKHTSVGSLANLELLFKGIDISHNDGCPNRNRFRARATRLLLEGFFLTVVVVEYRWRRNHGTASFVTIAICIGGIAVHSWGWRRGRRSTAASASKRRRRRRWGWPLFGRWGRRTRRSSWWNRAILLRRWGRRRPDHSLCSRHVVLSID